MMMMIMRHPVALFISTVIGFTIHKTQCLMIELELFVLLPRRTMGQGCPKCKETPSHMLAILIFLVLMYPYVSLGVPLVPKSHDTLVEIFRVTRYMERNKVHFSQFLRSI